jgi:uroporphyrinogen decarboxylase
MTPVERMNAAMKLRPTDRVPNAPFYEAPVCTYFGGSFREALLGGRTMADAHLEALETFRFDWVILGMGLIGGIIPEALGCHVEYPENDFPIIRETVVRSQGDLERLAESHIQSRRMDVFLDGVSRLHRELIGQVPIACEYVSPFTIATRLRGPTETMKDMIKQPELLDRLQDILVKLDIELGRLLLEAGVEYIFYGADMECPLLISPGHYRRLVHEPTRRVINDLARMGGRVLPHMCGDIIETGIVDMLLEMDIQGIMPGNLTQDQVLDLQALKQKVGERTCLFDNLNPNGSLLTGMPADVAAETRNHLKNAKGMSGYIFSTSGTTSPLIPRENFMAMNQEVLNFE